MGWRGQVLKHDADHGEPNPGGNRPAITFENRGRGAGIGRALDNPALWQDEPAVSVAAFYDLNGPSSGRGASLATSVAGSRHRRKSARRRCGPLTNLTIHRR